MRKPKTSLLEKDKKELLKLINSTVDQLDILIKRERARLFWTLVLSLTTAFSLVTASILYFAQHYEEAIFFMLLSVFGAIITRTER